MMLKKGLLTGSTFTSRHLSEEDKGNGSARPQDMENPEDSLWFLLIMSRISTLNPVEAALVLNDLSADDFNFEWKSALMLLDPVEKLLLRFKPHGKK